MSLRRCTITLLSVALAGAAVGQERSALPHPQAPMSGARLALALKSGGFTLYFRHAATDHSQTDRNRSAFDECSLQRNLSEAGRRDARVVGETIRAMKLAVSEVISSPYCRTMDTARLMFGRAIAMSHGNPLQAIAGGPELAEGEAAVIRGDGTRWTIVARIRVEDWRELSTEP